jgi:ubiquinone/menaquinone biosynthesis C-methylase UbiE/uncharacterized protein YbaR (Trm112 family)
MNGIIDDGLLSYICCPACGAELAPAGSQLSCEGCGKDYDVVEGIPVLVDLERLPEHTAGQFEYFTRESVSRGAYELAAWQRSYRDRFSENFNPAQGDLVVDCGTGTGYFAIELAGMGCECIACDLSLESLRRLRSEVKKRGLDGRVHLICCNAEELPLKNGIARYMLCNAVLEHLPAPQKTVREIDRVSAGEAGLMVTVPLAYRHLNPVFIPVNIIHDRRIGHLRRYDPGSLAGAFSGWELFRTYYTGHFAKVAKTLINMVIPSSSEDRIETVDRRKETRQWGASNIICFFRRG